MELRKEMLAAQPAGRKQKEKETQRNCDRTVQLTSETVSKIKAWNISRFISSKQQSILKGIDAHFTDL